MFKLVNLKVGVNFVRAEIQGRNNEKIEINMHQADKVQIKKQFALYNLNIDDELYKYEG